MLERLIGLSIRHRWLTLVLTAALVALGVWSYRHLSIDATPDKTYRGRIGFISPTAEFTPKTVETKEVRNDLVFRFRVIADDPDNVMRQGMPVTVTLRKDGGKP